jgi:hypothetical protein
MSRRSHADATRERLLTFWERDEDFGAPIGCLATTFTFSATFFEEECLARFVGVESDPRDDGRAYLIEREEKLSNVFVAVLVDRHHVASHRSLRWHQLPVRVPGGGIQHAKITLLVWEHRIRLLIGSANLTEPAYRRNFEHQGVLDFGPESEIPIALLEEVIDFLERIREFAPGEKDEAGDGPQPSITRFLSEVRRRIGDWESVSWKRSEPSVSFVGLSPGAETLFSQARDLFPSSTGPSDAWVLSPFFDEGKGARRTVDALLDVMGINGEREIDFLASGHELDDGERTIELNLPDCLREPWARRVTHRFQLVRGRDEEDESRPLHAKSLWLQRGNRAVYLVGSSNFTAAGTGVARGHSNIEANLAYVLPDLGDPMARKCAAAYPGADSIDLEERTVRFLEAKDRTEDATGAALLPEAFGLALFRPEGEAGVLILSIATGAPTGFRVLSEAGNEIMTEARWASGGHLSELECTWSLPKPPSYLRVCWTDEDGEPREATWIVNATETSKLPPPEELRSLGLRELLEILTSARPLHEAVGEMLRRQELRKESGPPIDGAVLDPHQKVDTRNFLLKRMRRFSAGLEGLRERLERPLWHIESLRWKLHGPVGPLALARSLVEQERDEVAFMLAEVALTVYRTDWSAVEESVGCDRTRTEIGLVLDELEKLAFEATAPPNLADYVNAAFKKIRQ